MCSTAFKDLQPTKLIRKLRHLPLVHSSICLRVKSVREKVLSLPFHRGSVTAFATTVVSGTKSYNSLISRKTHHPYK